MKNVWIVVGVMVLSVTTAVAEDMRAEHAGHVHGQVEDVVVAAPAGIHPVEREYGVIELNNEKCPVSGEDVSGKHFYEHNGINYAFCCNMCIRDFKKNPEQFMLSEKAVMAAKETARQTVN